MSNLTMSELTQKVNSKNISIVKRDGSVADFDANKISVALTKAFLDIEGKEAAKSTRIHELVAQLTGDVVDAMLRRTAENGRIHIEDIQDQVELALMRAGEQKVAREYVIYREAHKVKREPEVDTEVSSVSVLNEDGTKSEVDFDILKNLIKESCEGLDNVDPEKVFKFVGKNLFEGMKSKDVGNILVMASRGLIENDPNYSYVAARLLMDGMRKEALGMLQIDSSVNTAEDMKAIYPEYFKNYIAKGIELELIDEELGRYDLDKLGAAIDSDRDLKFTYLGLQTLYDRYFIHSNDVRFELPQAFFMRVAMGLAINEVDREERTIEFYKLLSSFDFMSSTPTLFNSGTRRPQLSSCYLTTVADSLSGIYDSLRDNALLSKYAGGLGNDWTRVRGLGSYIKGTNGKSQGVVPFLKVANDTAVAVNQGGKRKGAVCAYLETWHIDIEEFLDLRKNTGDDRRRTHDMNTANWIPDLFMQRVAEDKEWTLFTPSDTQDLHDLVGKEFEEAYVAYEKLADEGKLDVFKRVKANDLWRKMLGMLFETGHPWVTFKDPCNIRYTNQHKGVVHSSNLCTEITLHTNDSEIAVCNLGSINLPAHTIEGEGIDLEKLEKTVQTAMRMLDNVIEYNYYSVPQARKSNLQHRPVGLGIMGFQDSLYKMNLAYGSDDAVQFADSSMEAVSYFTIQASTDLAQERGKYSSFEGSLWSKGILPIDSLKNLAEVRGKYLQVDDSSSMDWDALRERVMTVGMRNSNTMAIAPTATISNICGVSQSIEPTYQNLYVKSNLSGEFTVVNPYLVRDLKKLDLWDEVMVNDLKYYDGSVLPIERIPAELKAIYRTSFEIDPRWLIEAGARRQKWIDQAQSLNLYMAEPSGKKLDNLYKLAWVRGLKTTYYLRSMGATHMEKTAAPKTETPVIEQPQTPVLSKPETPVESVKAEDGFSLSDEALSTEDAPKACSILDPSCEACQ